MAPLRAVLKAVQVNPDADSDRRRDTNGKQIHKDADTTKDGIGNDSQNNLHIRPLHTAGDLMLALFELMDPTLFSRGYIQILGDMAMRESPSAWSPLCHYFRVTYRVGRPNKWYYLTPSPRLSTRNEDLVPYLCPHLCSEAFDARALPSVMETVEMKVWVSNFIRSYKHLNGIGGSEHVYGNVNTENNSSIGTAFPAPNAQTDSVQSITVDVQLVRHIEDAYLHWSQVHRPSKAELRAQVSGMY